jgi:hypothetical protein
MAERPPQSLTDFGNRIRNLQGLLFISTILEQEPRMVARVRNEGAVLAPHPEVLLDAVSASTAFRVTRVRYESPLELLLQYGQYAVGGGGAVALYPVAKKMFDLWDRFNQSRLTHSDTSVRLWKNKVEIAAAQAELETIVDEHLYAADTTTLPLREATGLAVEMPPITMSQAVEALLDIRAIELEGEPA